jgi:CheY-like chemotaxis protein
MCNVLIVEDREDLCRQLVSLLEEELPGAQIDAAVSVAAGLELISKAHYEIAILDLKLPMHAGESDHVNGSLCLALHGASPEALVIHITGYPDEDEIQRHMTQSHIGLDRTRAVFISKLESPAWPDEVIKIAKSFHYGTRIETYMNALFRPRADYSSAASGRNRQETLGRDTSIHSGQSATHTLAALMRDIHAHWDDLDEAVQKDIRQVFAIDDTRRPIGISLQ